MSSTAPQPLSSDPRKLFLPPAWLISKPVGLLLLVGGVFVSFAFFFLWRVELVETQTLMLLWIFVFHGPHFWGQISRTFLERSERALRGSVLAARQCDY